MQVVQAKCPNCGAGLTVGPGADRATCAYCGVSSFVQRRSTILQRPLPLPAAARGLPSAQVARQHVSPLGKLLVTLPLLGILAGIVAPIAVCVSEGREKAAARNGMRWGGGGPALLADVDGDGTEDAIGLVRYVLDGDRVHLAAFSGKDGHRLWQSARLGTYSEINSGRLAIAGATLVWADKRGTLRGFAGRTGAASWTTALGDVAKAMCWGPSRAQIDVMTADRRWQRVTLADGAATPAPDRAREPCDALPNDDPRELTDGAGTVVTDAFGDNVPAVPGMRVTKLVERRGGPRIAIGTRSPGTAVPMIAAVDAAGAVRWKAEVPSSDPLTVEASAPEWFAVGSDDVAVLYEREDLRPPVLAGFDAATGARRWEAAVAKGTTIVVRGVSLSGDSVFVSSWGHLQVFDRATGHQRFMVGAL